MDFRSKKNIEKLVPSFDFALRFPAKYLFNMAHTLPFFTCSFDVLKIRLRNIDTRNVRRLSHLLALQRIVHFYGGLSTFLSHSVVKFMYNSFLPHNGLRMWTTGQATVMWAIRYSAHKCDVCLFMAVPKIVVDAGCKCSSLKRFLA